MLNTLKNNYHWFFIGLLLLIALALFIIFLSGGHSISDNVVPEIIGFCLDGALLVFAINYFNRRKTFRDQAETKAATTFLILERTKLLRSKNFKRLDLGKESKTKIIEQFKETNAGLVNHLEALLPFIAAIGPGHLYAFAKCIDALNDWIHNKDKEIDFDLLLFFIDCSNVFDKYPIPEPKGNALHIYYRLFEEYMPEALSAFAKNQMSDHIKNESALGNSRSIQY